MTQDSNRVIEVLRPWIAWFASLFGIALIFLLLTTPFDSGLWSAWAVLAHSAGELGLLIPFTTFVFGAAIVCRVRGTCLRTAVILGIAAGSLSYGSLAYVHPILRFRHLVEGGADELRYFPFGPGTPAGLLRRRAAVLADPPAQYSFSVDQPLASPPNLLTLTLFLPAVLAAFALLNALLGLLTAEFTQDLPPPRRRNARWAVGLFGGLAFFIAIDAADSWARTSVEVSGMLAAWLPLAVPIAEALLLVLLIRRWKLFRAGPDSGA